MQNAKTTIEILVADEHPSFLEGICSIIHKNSDMKVTGIAEDGNQIKPMISDLRPDILLFDLIMPNLSPLYLVRWIRNNYPETSSLILTAHDSDAYLANMMDAGAAGYLDKKLQTWQIVSSIRRAASGEFVFEKTQMDRVTRWKNEVICKWKSLSERERETLQMLTEGAGNKKIASLLDITVDTVEKHLKNIYKKLGVSSRTEAVVWWLEKGTDFRT